MANWISALFFFLLFAAPLFASPEMDDRYALKTVVGAVVAPVRESVHFEQVEATLVTYLQENSRYEFAEEQYSAFKARVALIQIPDIEAQGPDIPLEPYKALIAEAGVAGVQGILLLRILPIADAYVVAGVLVNCRTGELVHSAKVEVADFRRLQSFADAARRVLGYLTEGIPFHATVMSRQGYRLVLDRGLPHIRKGMRLTAYTVEVPENEILFEETGIMMVTHSEKSLAFANLIADRRPREIAPGNKAFVGGSLSDGLTVAGSSSTRELASESVAEVRREGLGAVGLDVGGVLVNVTNSSTNGVTQSTGSTFHPGVRLSGEVQATARIHGEMAVQFATSSVSDAAGSTALALNSKVSSFRFAVGYRRGASSLAEGVQVHFKLGYAQQSYSIDPSPAPLQFTSQKYSGILLGGGVSIPLNEVCGLGVGLTLMPFPSLTETPVTSGASFSASTGWDFGITGYYHLMTNLDARMQVAFQSHGADFTGTGTRDQPQFSSSQTARAILLGLSYYF